MANITADILPNSAGPALSATSDAPQIAPPLSEEINTGGLETKPGEVTESKPVAETVEGTEAPEKPADGKKPKPTLQERMGELTAQRKAAEGRADALADSLEKALVALKEATPKPTEKPEIPPVPRPDRAKFDDPAAYDDALVAWSSEQAAKLERARAETEFSERGRAAEKTAADTRIAEANAALQKDWSAKRDAAVTEFPDYAEVAEADDLSISIPMATAILNADNGPAIAYHLGKHPEEATRISGLSALKQAIEIGKIEARLAAPKAQPSRAPAPIVPIAGAGRSGEKSAAEESTEEYAARRNKEAGGRLR